MSEPRDGGLPIALRGLPNTRDLGGIRTEDGRTVKHRRLLRSGALASATPQDMQILVDEYNMVAIVDFRDSQEKINNPDPVPEGVTHYELPVFTEERKGITREGLDVEPTTVGLDSIQGLSNEAAIKEREDYVMERLVDYLESMEDDPHANLRESYALMVTAPHSIRTYRGFFDVLLQHEEGAILYHCAAGKDRVGIGTALILHVLGVSRERIMEDYLYTNDCYADQLARLRQGAQARGLGEEIEDGLTVLVGVDEDLIGTALDAIESNYGSIDAFISDKLKLSDAEIARMRELYLD